MKRIRNQGRKGALNWKISRKFICTVGFLLVQRYSIIAERQGDRNSRPKKRAASRNIELPKTKKRMNSAGLFLNEWLSSMLE